MSERRVSKRVSKRKKPYDPADAEDVKATTRTKKEKIDAHANGEPRPKSPAVIKRKSISRRTPSLAVAEKDSNNSNNAADVLDDKVKESTLEVADAATTAAATTTAATNTSTKAATATVTAAHVALNGATTSTTSTATAAATTTTNATTTTTSTTTTAAAATAAPKIDNIVPQQSSTQESTQPMDESDESDDDNQVDNDDAMGMSLFSYGGGNPFSRKTVYHITDDEDSDDDGNDDAQAAPIIMRRNDKLKSFEKTVPFKSKYVVRPGDDSDTSEDDEPPAPGKTEDKAGFSADEDDAPARGRGKRRRTLKKTSNKKAAEAVVISDDEEPTKHSAAKDDSILLTSDEDDADTHVIKRMASKEVENNPAVRLAEDRLKILQHQMAMADREISPGGIIKTGGLARIDEDEDDSLIISTRITITVRILSGDTKKFPFKTDETFHSLIAQVAKWRDVPFKWLHLSVGGQEINGSQTPNDLPNPLGIIDAKVTPQDLPGASGGRAENNDGSYLKIVVQSESGKVEFELKKTDKLNKLIDAYCEKTKVNPKRAIFSMDGTKVGPGTVVNSMDIDSDDEEVTIDVSVKP